MNYKEVINNIIKKIPCYQKQGEISYKIGLKGIKLLCDYFNNPQFFLKMIHVGGTNGKGSVSNMLSSILQESGYKVGLFTSPHLKSFRERIRINNKLIKKKFIVNFFNNNNIFFKKHNFSFFEINTILAFYYFKKNNVDFAIIEVGLGGRLDSTNIINPLLSVITSIGLDHISFLGNTLNEISYEKAGIIKYKTPVVVSSNILNEQKKLISYFAKKKKSKIYFSNKTNNFSYYTPLLGIYQIINQNIVLKVIDVLIQNGVKISNNSIKNGFNNVFLNTNFKGRWQCIEYKPKIICDIGHNIEAIKFIVSQLKLESYNNLHLVLGFVKDKLVKDMLSLFPIKSFYYFCEPNVERKLSINILKEQTKNFYLNSMYFNTVLEAFLEAKKKASRKDLIFVGGSTFVVSEIL